MTIRNLEERRRAWGHKDARGPRGGHDCYDSLPYPFEAAGVQMVFDGKDVLEIGPGNGRQYERVRARARSYSIADICADVLLDPVFGHVNTGYLLDDWGQSLNDRFDVIHFWYVLHHICHGEMAEFFAFVSRHLRSAGLALFNCPEPINVQGEPEGDGCGTTYSDPDVVRSAIGNTGLQMIMASPIGRKSTGFVIMLRKVQP